MKKLLLILVIFSVSATAFASQLTHISNQELKNLITQGVSVIDVRTTSEWQKTGVIENSHLIMFFDETGRYDLNTWLDEVAAVANKDEPIVLICHSGGRSEQLANYLTQVAGYKQVYNLERGIMDWIKQKNSVVPPN